MTQIFLIKFAITSDEVISNSKISFILFYFLKKTTIVCVSELF